MPPPLPAVEETRERARQLYINEGLNYQAIADRLSTKPGTIRTWIRRYGWKQNTTAVLESVRESAVSTGREIGAKHAHEIAAVIRNTIDDYKLFRSKILELTPSQANTQSVKHLTSAWAEVTSTVRTALGLDLVQHQPHTLVNLSVTGATSVDPLGQAKPVIPIDVDDKVSNRS